MKYNFILQSSDTKDPDSASRLDPDSNPLGLDQEQVMRMRNQAAADLEFQRDLEVRGQTVWSIEWEVHV